MSLVKWRHRLGEEGCEKILKEIIEVGVKTETIEEKDLQIVIADTTVHEKAITFPTDAKLQHRARILLLKEALDQVRLSNNQHVIPEGIRYPATWM